MPLLIYSLLRLGLFVLALVGLWFAGMGSWLLVVVAVIVSAALSYVILGKQRDAAVEWLEHRRTAPQQGPRLSKALQDDAAAEDAAVDRLHDEQAAPDAQDQGAQGPDLRGAGAQDQG